MLQDAPGSPDGVTVNQYEQGKEYDVTEDLAAVFIAEGLADEVQAEKPKPRQNKNAGKAAENK